METYYKIRLQGNQLHFYITVDGICIAHRVFSAKLGLGWEYRERVASYYRGIRALGLCRRVA